MSVTAGDLAVDRELAEISGRLPWIRLVTPTNVPEQRALFEVSYEEPEFEYVPIPDLGDLSRRLEAVDPESTEDPVVRSLARKKQRELTNLLDLVTSRGTDRFLAVSIDLFGHVDETVADLALEVLAAEEEPETSSPVISAEAFADIARREVDSYRQVYPEMTTRVFVSDTTTGVRVENGDLYIGADTRFKTANVEPLLSHEVGVHALTFANGTAQPLHLLAAGLAGYDENQEALGALAEYLVGGLRPARLRVLALRVVAARLRSENTGFAETYRHLRDLGAGRQVAFTTTMRAHRGGGLTKDAVYLRGLVRLVEYLANSGDLDTLFLGKLSLEDEHLIAELRHREVLREPPLVPRFLEDSEARRRLSEVRNGTTVPYRKDVNA